MPAFVLHQKKKFRANFFKNTTPVVFSDTVLLKTKSEKAQRRVLGIKENIKQKIFGAYDFFNENRSGENIQSVQIGQDDFLVIPEVYGPGIGNAAKGSSKIIFNQNAHYTFDGYPLEVHQMDTPYGHKEVIAVITVSKHNQEYLSHAFPSLKLNVIHYGFDPKIFYPQRIKKKQIAFMSRKLRKDAVQIINILKYRNALRGFNVVEIDSVSEERVAEILRESLIFLSFSHEEGWGMPASEAMASGCLVIGYDGFAGKEFFLTDHSYPVMQGDILSFSKTLERAINEYEINPKAVLDKGLKASEFILKEFSLEREEREVVSFWKEILQQKTRTTV